MIARITIVLLTACLIVVTMISIEQNQTIIQNTVLLRSMRDNPQCMVAPVWQGKLPKHHHGDMYLTPAPPHHPHVISEN